MFYKKLKELRDEHSLSQEELAKRIGYSQSHIAKWEKNIYEPTATALLKIAEYFNVSTDYLLGKEETKGTIKLNTFTQHEYIYEQSEIELLQAYRKLPDMLKHTVRPFMESISQKTKTETKKQ